MTAHARIPRNIVIYDEHGNYLLLHLSRRVSNDATTSLSFGALRPSDVHDFHCHCCPQILTGDGVSVTVVNVPGECRPFGFEKYWLAKVEEAAPATNTTPGAQRRLREAVPMSQWLLQDALKTNPVECKEYVDRAVADDTLFDHQSEHSSFQITSPLVSVRINHGKIHQLAMRDPTDTIDLPDHVAYQMNVQFNKLVLGDDPRGAIGETVHPVLDENGFPIMQGIRALRGDEEDYRVECFLCDDFAQLHAAVSAGGT